jgi:hypothetical protein
MVISEQVFGLDPQDYSPLSHLEDFLGPTRASPLRLRSWSLLILIRYCYCVHYEKFIVVIQSFIPHLFLSRFSTIQDNLLNNFHLVSPWGRRPRELVQS